MRKALLINLLMLLIATLLPNVSYASGIQRTSSEEDFEKSKYQWEQILYLNDYANDQINKLLYDLNSVMILFPSYEGYITFKEELMSVSQERQNTYETYILPYANNQGATLEYTGGYTDEIYYTAASILNTIKVHIEYLASELLYQNEKAIEDYGSKAQQKLKALDDSFIHLGIDLGVFDNLLWKIEDLSNLYGQIPSEYCAERKESFDKLTEFATKIASMQRYIHSAKLSVTGLQNAIEYFQEYTNNINSLTERFNILLSLTLGNNVDVDNELDNTCQVAETETMSIYAEVEELWENIADNAHTEEQRICFVMYAHDYLFSFASQYIESLIIIYPAKQSYLETHLVSIQNELYGFVDMVNNLDYLSDEGFQRFVMVFNAMSENTKLHLDWVDSELNSFSEIKFNILSMIETTKENLSDFHLSIRYYDFTALNNFYPYINTLLYRLEYMESEVRSTDDDNQLNEFANEIVYIQELLYYEKNIVNLLNELYDCLNDLASKITEQESSLKSEYDTLYLDFISFSGSYMDGSSIDYSNLESKLDEMAHQLAIFNTRYNQLYSAFAGVDYIVDDIDNCKVRYFNTHGAEIQNPEKGQLVIRVDGSGKASKILIK